VQPQLRKEALLPTLSDLIALRRDEIIERFISRAREHGAAEALPTDQVVNSLGEFIDELTLGLNVERPKRPGMTSPSGRSHGRQRFSIGYELGAVIREYRVLREVLFDVIEESGITVSLRDLRTFGNVFIDAITDAASQYGAERDAELRKRTAQHVAFLAHELRNPLGSVKLGLDLMSKRGDLRPSRSLDVIERGIERLSTLIDDSLVTLRNAMAIEVEYVTLDVRRLVADVVSESAAEIEAKEHHLEVEGDASLSADPKLLRSAISNLVRNAVKFTGPGGVIHVRIKQAAARVRIEVEDACGGLPPNATKKLFDPFVQAGADRSGFGLGLAICKQVAEAHGGEIRVHDIPGHGCAFILDLPETPVPPPRE